jgi:hypothetical protein
VVEISLQIKMTEVIDIEIIANALFKSLLFNIQDSEKNIISNVSNLKRLIRKNNDDIKEISSSLLGFIYSEFNDIKSRLDKFLDVYNEENINIYIDKKITDVINKIYNISEIVRNEQEDSINTIIDDTNIKFQELLASKKYEEPSKPSKSYTNTRNRKGRNSELTDIKKYCGHSRSRNKGPCRIMIYNNQEACYIHKSNIMLNRLDDVDNLQASKINNYENKENNFSIKNVNLNKLLIRKINKRRYKCRKQKMEKYKQQLYNANNIINVEEKVDEHEIYMLECILCENILYVTSINSKEDAICVNCKKY